jgi:hypothetical protein
MKLEIKLTSKFHLPLLIVSGVLFITVLMPWISVAYGIGNWEIMTLIMSLVGIELAFVTSQKIRAMGAILAGALAILGVVLAWAVDIRSFFGFGIILSLLSSLGLLAIGLVDYMQMKQPTQSGQPSAGQPYQPGQPSQQGQPSQPRPLQIKYVEPIMLALLTIVTFGIYGLLWYINTKNQLNANGAQIPSAFYLFIPGLNVYWIWKFAEGLEFVTAKKMEGMTTFLFLCFLGPIGMAVVQDNLNKLYGLTAPPPSAPPPAYNQPTPPPSQPSQPQPPPPPPAPRKQ